MNSHIIQSSVIGVGWRARNYRHLRNSMYHCFLLSFITYKQACMLLSERTISLASMSWLHFVLLMHCTQPPRSLTCQSLLFWKAVNRLNEDIEMAIFCDYTVHMACRLMFVQKGVSVRNLSSSELLRYDCYDITSILLIAYPDNNCNCMFYSIRLYIRSYKILLCWHNMWWFPCRYEYHRHQGIRQHLVNNVESVIKYEQKCISQMTGVKTFTSRQVHHRNMLSSW